MVFVEIEVDIVAVMIIGGLLGAPLIVGVANILPGTPPPMVEGRGGRGPDHPTLLLIVALGEAIWPIIPYRNHRDVVLTAYGL